MAELSNLGKKAEAKIKEWLDRPEDGYCFQRIPDQQTGFFGSKNICDFFLYKKPNMYFIESKATWNDNFPFAMLTDFQYDGLLKESKIEGVTSYVAVLFATYKRAFLIDIKDIQHCIDDLKVKSLNIKKIAKWPIPYKEIKTVPSRKQLLDYSREDNVL